MRAHNEREIVKQNAVAPGVDRAVSSELVADQEPEKDQPINHVTEKKKELDHTRHNYDVAGNMDGDSIDKIGYLQTVSAKGMAGSDESDSKKKAEKKREDAAHLRRMDENAAWQKRMDGLLAKIDRDLDELDEKQRQAEENELAIQEGLHILKHGTTEEKRAWLSDPKKGQLDPENVARMSDDMVDEAFPEELRKKIDLHKEFMEQMEVHVKNIQQDLDDVREAGRKAGLSPEQIEEKVRQRVDRLEANGQGVKGMKARAESYGIELDEFNQMKDAVRKQANRDYDIFEQDEQEQRGWRADLNILNTAKSQVPVNTENPFGARTGLGLKDNAQETFGSSISVAESYAANPFEGKVDNISQAFRVAASGEAVGGIQNEPQAPDVDMQVASKAVIPNPFV